MTATHPCDACGGRGWRVFCDEHGCTEDCPVCLGAGSFPDRMPALDAVSDAETLREVAAEEFVDDPDATWLEIQHLDEEMKGCGLKIHPTDGWAAIWAPYQRITDYHIARAARAAFRAVPGLR